jgi:hypothetical protein
MNEGPMDKSSLKLNSIALQKIKGEYVQKSNDELGYDVELLDISIDLLPKLGVQWNLHNLVTLKRQTLSRTLYFNSLYQEVLSVPGVILEFGVQWGSSLAQLINLRGIYEPYNHSRKIIGFDTFEGFLKINTEDGIDHGIGDYKTTDNYENTLNRILEIHESNSPLSHIKKFELIKGDASNTIHSWLSANPHAIVSMAIFDMDLYRPTRDVLQAIIPRLTKGSLLIFDELNCEHFPGETVAVNEILGLNNLALKRHPHQPNSAWAVFGG